MIDEDLVLKENLKFEGGYIKPIKDDRNFNFGDGQLPLEDLGTGGHYQDDVPLLETQNRLFETFHCTVFSTIKALLIIMYVKYFKGQDKDQFFADNDKSERFTGVEAKLSTSGGSPLTVIQSIKDKGLLPQKDLDWTDDINTWSKYSSPRPMTKVLEDKAAKWLEDYEVGYDYVKTSYGNWLWKFIRGALGIRKLSVSNQALIKDALKYSPLCASGYAWIFRNGKAYKTTQQDNHWFTIVDYVDGDYWLIYDNYNNCWVKCEWTYPFGFILRYTLKKINNTTMLKTIKKKDSPEIYLISTTAKNLRQIKGWESYQDMLIQGYIYPYDEVDDLGGYVMLDDVLTIGK
jgi:hypothetical protein